MNYPTFKIGLGKLLRELPCQGVKKVEKPCSRKFKQNNDNEKSKVCKSQTKIFRDFETLTNTIHNEDLTLSLQ